jgi:hypothetical protein
MLLIILGISIGLLMLGAALFNWEWFFMDSDSRLIKAIGGERTVRIFWGIAGSALIGFTLYGWLWG